MAPTASERCRTEFLQHVLGFLEADEAVRTSVLARRWSGLWRFMPSLCVIANTISSSRNFVDHLLNLRGRSTLQKCFFRFYFDEDDSWLSIDDVNCLKRWIRYALLQEVEELSVRVYQELVVSFRSHLDNLRVVSQFLTKLQLVGLTLHKKSVDFSACPVLKELNVTQCYTTDDESYYNIISPSLSCLIVDEFSFLKERRAYISTPNLISLRVTYCSGLTPIFEYMPALVTAIVIFSNDSEDYCFADDPGYCVDDSCARCYAVDDGSEFSVLLRAVANAMNLELISPPHVFILKRDLRFCPTFSKLKTLLFNGWCVVPEQCALACILKHSPVLEKLTIDLCGDQIYDCPHIKKQIVPSKAAYNSMELENLNTVEVKCYEVTRWIFKVMKSLITYGIPLPKISIQQKSRYSEHLNFACVGFSLNQS